MGKGLEAACDVGFELLQTERGNTIAKGALGGVAAIGTGTAIETAGTLIGAPMLVSAGSTLTGVGCAAAQTAITATGAIPLVGEAIAVASTAVFTVASSPVVVGCLLVGGLGESVRKPQD